MFSKIKNGLGKLLYSNTFSAVHGYVQMITMFGWLILLHFTSACYVIYLLTGLCGYYCRIVCNQDKQEIFKKIGKIESDSGICLFPVYHCGQL